MSFEFLIFSLECSSSSLGAETRTLTIEDETQIYFSPLTIVMQIIPDFEEVHRKQF